MRGREEENREACRVKYAGKEWVKMEKDTEGIPKEEAGREQDRGLGKGDDD